MITETRGKREYLPTSYVPGMQESGRPALRVAGAGQAWLLCRATVGREMFLYENVIKLGWECYRPILLKPAVNRRTKRVEHQQTPMFPGYLLVRPAAGQGLKVYCLPYLAAVDRLALMDSLVKTMKRRETDGILAMMDRKSMGKGSKVRVATADTIIDAVVGEPMDHKRIELVTKLFNGSARFYCTAEQVIGTA